MPVTFKGHWQRDWRVRGELVGPAELSFLAEGVGIWGRKTSPIRSLLGFFSRLLGLLVQLIVFGAVLLTASGLLVRFPALRQFTVMGTLFMVPMAALTVHGVFVVFQRIVQPHCGELVPWSRVTELTTDGLTLQLKVHTGRGLLWGHLKPRWWWGRRAARAIFQSLRDGATSLPGVPVGRGVRSAWWDRVAVLVALIAAGIGGAAGLVTLNERLEERAARSSGPLAGAPSRPTPRALEELKLGGCTGSNEVAVQVRREGADLHWSALRAGLTMTALRWDPRLGAGQWLTTTSNGRAAKAPGFFATSPDAAAVSVVTRRGVTPPNPKDEEQLRRAWCRGEVHGVHIATNQSSKNIKLKAFRNHDALEVTVEGAAGGAWVLPIRRYVDQRPGWQQVCDVPSLKGRLGALEAKPRVEVPGFFAGADEQALVLLLEPAAPSALSWLADGPTTRRCLTLEALAQSGFTLQSATSPLTAAPSRLYTTAATQARARSMFSPGAGAQAALDGVTSRYADVRAALKGSVRSAKDEQDVVDGVLSAVPWSALLDEVSIRGDLPRLERARQRLDGQHPDAEAGRRFLIQLIQSFLSRIKPTPDQWLARYQVASDYLLVRYGARWTVGGRAVQVGDPAAADLYNLLGRFMLMDLGRNAERDFADGRASRVEMVVLEAALNLWDVHLDMPVSSLNKALWAWGTGDFEYVLGRVWLKANESIRDEAAAISSAAKAKYTLQGGWSGEGGAARYAELARDGRALGWIARFDARKMQVDWGKARALPRGALLACAASYVTADKLTAGFAMMNGQVTNFAISSKMDGLVVLRPGAPPLILDLKRGATLPDGHRSLRPLVDLNDLSELVDWLREEGASAFQTHLLVSDGALVIDSGRASAELRERRLLVTARFGRSPIVAIIDIPGGSKMSLHEAALVSLHAMTTPAPAGPGLTVEGVANLDVGSYDILQAFDSNGKVLRVGPVPISNAHNLLTVAR
ncbi:hypothetical protein L6R49_20075 [Myxococcota bacterium]|nr:hypothetical protein [Myxococcota bacterium]